MFETPCVSSFCDLSAPQESQDEGDLSLFITLKGPHYLPAAQLFFSLFIPPPIFSRTLVGSY